MVAIGKGIVNCMLCFKLIRLFLMIPVLNGNGQVTFEIQIVWKADPAA
jgi:hypothetical protein